MDKEKVYWKSDLPRLLKHLNIVRKTGEEIECLFPEGSNSVGKVKIVKDTGCIESDTPRVSIIISVHSRRFLRAF